MVTVGILHYLLIGNLLTNVLFGVYVQMAWKCSCIFYRKYQMGQVHSYHLFSFILLALTFTLKIIIDNYTTVHSFMSPDEDGTVSFPPFNAPTVLILNTAWVVETAVADLFIIYRLWIVWHKNIYFTIIPLLLLLAGFADGIYLTYLMSTLKETDPTDSMQQLNFTSNAFLVTTLGLNVVCTSLIAIKLFSLRRPVSISQNSSRSDPATRIVTIIIESAAIYTAMIVACLVANATSSLLLYIFLPLLHPTVAIVFSSIILRSASGTAWEGNGTVHGQMPSSGIRSQNIYDLPQRSLGGNDLTSTGVLQIKLDRVVTKKVDREDDYRKFASQV